MNISEYIISLSFFLRYLTIVAFVLLGILVYNDNNSKGQKDITGRNKFLLTAFISLIIYNSTKLLPSNATYVISLVLGLGSQKLIHKWITEEIWNKYDVLNKNISFKRKDKEVDENKEVNENKEVDLNDEEKLDGNET